jgi:hypothetical protein
MSRRHATDEPAFGTDSFLDVTANLVGVLIVFIVLIGMRVRKSAVEVTASDVERLLPSLHDGLHALTQERGTLERELQDVRRALAGHQRTMTDVDSAGQQQERRAGDIQDEFQSESVMLSDDEAELARAQAQLVSLSRDLAAPRPPPVAGKKLQHRSPIGRTLNSDELQFELMHGRATYVDLEGLMDRVRSKSHSLENDLRVRGRATDEAGPVGAFRIRYTMAREDLPFTQSMFYTRSSFNVRLSEWQIIPQQDPRGESVEEATQASSQMDQVLTRHSANKFAITIWVYPDSFGEFRALRDYLSDRGYSVAARPIPFGLPMGASALGSRSVAQ